MGPIDTDPEDFYLLDSKEEIEQFIESYKIGGFERYSELEYDYDVDNYAYDDYEY